MTTLRCNKRGTHQRCLKKALRGSAFCRRHLKEAKERKHIIEKAQADHLRRLRQRATRARKRRFGV